LQDLAVPAPWFFPGTIDRRLLVESLQIANQLGSGKEQKYETGDDIHGEIQFDLLVSMRHGTQCSPRLFAARGYGLDDTAAGI
jgi:hypothetical protein